MDVVGVSGDSVENQRLFKEIKELNFTLLADEKGAVARKFGVPVSRGGDFPTKDKEGKPITLHRGVTIARWTFVIGKDGRIAYKEKVKSAAGDSKHILEVVEKLEK